MVAYLPVKETENLDTLNRQKLTEFLSHIAPNKNKEIGINARMNVLTVDVTTDVIVEKLKAIPDLGDIRVHSFLAHGKETITGVISDVDLEINDVELKQLISSTICIVNEKN